MRQKYATQSSQPLGKCSLETGFQLLKGNQEPQGFENDIEGRGLVSRIGKPNSQHPEQRLHAEGGIRCLWLAADNCKIIEEGSEH
jgi:hypothetical protein